MVLGGEHRNALGIVRNLGSLGIPIFVGGNSLLARSLYSRFASKRFVYPPVSQGLEATQTAVIEKVRQLRPRALLPCMDDDWKLVRTFYDEYTEYTSVVPCPTEDVFAQVINKGTMTQRAQEIGVDTPKTFLPQPGDPDSAMGHGLPYPVLVKPLRGIAGKGIHIANDAIELVAAIDDLEAPFLIQEFIDGQDLDLTILCDHGEPLAGSAYINLRNAPLPYGPPVACRTIEDAQLMASGVKFLRGLAYHGVAHLDYRQDPRDRKPKLLDFNARLAGTNEISILSGVNFPLLLYRLALGEKVEPCFHYMCDLEFRWILFGELRHFIQTTDKGRVARDLLKLKNVKTNIRLTDPFPHVAHLLGMTRSSALP